MTRILFEVNGKKYYRDSYYIYFDMYMKDKDKCLPLMENNYKLKYQSEEVDIFENIYIYYWNAHWGWVKDEYIELSDEELCSCTQETFVFKDNYMRCFACKKVIVMFAV